MEQSCGQCKWFGDGKDTLHNRNICNYPIPAWLLDHVLSGPADRLADFVHESHGRECRTFERRQEP